MSSSLSVWDGLSPVDRSLYEGSQVGVLYIPVEALQIEVSVPPLYLDLDKCKRNAALQFNKLGKNSMVLQWLPDEWRSGEGPSVIVPKLPSTTKNPNLIPMQQHAYESLASLPPHTTK